MPPKSKPAAKKVAKKVAKPAAAKKVSAKKTIAKKPAAAKAKKAAKPSAAAKVKKAPSAYMLYCKDERAKVIKANPKATFGEVGKLLGAGWSKLSDAQKAKYKK